MSFAAFFMSTIQPEAPGVFWRPVTATNSINAWQRYPGNSTSSIHTYINEETPDDSTYAFIQSIASGYPSLSMKFSGPTLPLTLTRIVVRLRISNRTSSGGAAAAGYTMTVTVAGTSYIAEPLTGSWTQYEASIPVANSAGWNFSNLQVALIPSGAATGKRPSCSWIEMEFQ